QRLGGGGGRCPFLRQMGSNKDHRGSDDMIGSGSTSLIASPIVGKHFAILPCWLKATSKSLPSMPLACASFPLPLHPWMWISIISLEAQMIIESAQWTSSPLKMV
ncbi:MAG: hypothetical protein ACKPKO_14310, partial [Candidatus Fonsibacter sp.]